MAVITCLLIEALVEETLGVFYRLFGEMSRNDTSSLVAFKMNKRYTLIQFATENFHAH